ncbi:uncharacterized protein LOC133741866 [Rosa rugosa]|uniref:uncharacterized protein LOC133741866 n=2 Tax=Rosa rugosa TaxID=74645 RepID=UPI002B415445|nr:uncharacterized protein LOC133707317 isoform X1 [Rosa rugosa]XP_062025563.1 uncharacterized protein LOC133741866 [Rosa rugosa]
MDTSYVVKFIYSGEAATVPLLHNWSFVDLCNSIRSRFPDLIQGNFMLRYIIPPDSTSCFLESEVDMRMIFRNLVRYNSDFVEVFVTDLPSISESVVSNTVCEDSSTMLEENDYLGCYRAEAPKSYMTKGWESYIHSEGQKFEGGVVEFRDKLRKYAIEIGFSYEFVRNDKVRVIAQCSKKHSQGCNWLVKAYLCRANGFFMIKRLVNVHTCHGVIRLQKSKMMGSKVVKSIVLDKIRANPNKKPIDIADEIKSDYGLDVAYRTVWYGTELAKTALHGDEAESYAQLLWFSESVMKSNPDSRIVVEFHRETHRFQRMFVSYGAWMKGFQSCRPILFIDATFITNKYKGQIIAASAKDANQGLYPVAYAIVDSENESNWSFFLEVLAEEFAKHPMRRVTFISDRHVGLVSAFPRVFPNNPHGFCFRHLMSNLSDKFPAGSYLKDRIPYLFMCCAYSRTPEMYEFNMEILRSEGGDIVAQFLEDLPKENWCMAYFNGERFGEMTNNLAESFNNWVLPLKSLPILDINDGIRVKSMASIAARKQDAHEWFSELCPVIEKKLKDNLEVGRHWRVSRSDTYVYEVHCQKYNSMVNLESRFCSCGEWQLYGFPCSHALVVIQQHGSSPYLYVNELYKVDKYRETYSFPINPLPSISKQVHDFGRDAVILQPPLTRRPPGRPRKKRFRKRSEKTRVIKCGRCGKCDGHNRKSCTAPI